MASLDELEARVAALEAQAGRDSGGSIGANYLTIDAQGHVSANFSGVINAQGVSLPTASTSSPSNPNRVVWNRPSDSAMTAQVYSTYTPGSGSTAILEADDVGHGADAALSTAGQAGIPSAALNVISNNPGGSAQILAVVNKQAPGVGSYLATVLDSLGNSSFAQLAAAVTAFAGVLAATAYQGVGTPNGGVRLVDDAGHHISMQWTGSVLQFFVDGTAVSVA